MPGTEPTRKGRLWNRSWPEHPALRADVDVTVPFQDADPTGMAWHGNYFRYYDTARVALLRALQFGYREMQALGQFWPIIDTRVRYIDSMGFGDRVTVSAQLVEWEFRLRIYYQILDEQARRINEAYTVQVPVRAADESLILGVPGAFQARIQALLDGEVGG